MTILIINVKENLNCKDVSLGLDVIFNTELNDL